MRIRFGLLLLLLCAVSAPLRAQDTYQELAQRFGRAPIYHEPLALPGTAQPVVAVAFRIPNSRLVFVRNRRETPGRLFVAEAEVTVQLYRGLEMVTEQVWRRSHYAATFEDTQRRDQDLEGAVRFDVSPGPYGYRIFLKDANTEELRQSAVHPIWVPAFESAGLGRAIMARSVGAEAGVVMDLVVLGGDVPYGESAVAVVPLGLPEGIEAADATLRYTLWRRAESEVRAEEQARARAVEQARREDELPALPPRSDRPGTEGTRVASGTIAGPDLLPLRGTPRVEEGRLVWTVSGAPTGYAAVVPLDGPHLPDGAYRLDATLQVGDRQVVGQTYFNTHWRDMPVSLRSPDVALRQLSFIEDRKTVRALRKGSRGQQEQRLRAYWKERDPTPETEFNELMAEYYRRVDHAAVAFQTGQVPFPDGLETDRGRVYIVHGAPASMQRSYPPEGGVRELWTYDGGRRFVFWAPSGIDELELQDHSGR